MFDNFVSRIARVVRTERMGIAVTPPRGASLTSNFYIFVEKTIWRAAIVSELTTDQPCIERN